MGLFFQVLPEQCFPIEFFLFLELGHSDAVTVVNEKFSEVGGIYLYVKEQMSLLNLIRDRKKFINISTRDEPSLNQNIYVQIYLLSEVRGKKKIVV